MGYFAKRKDELQHHGIRGQKWGVRRFQNKDGTLTPAGRKHVAEDSDFHPFLYNKLLAVPSHQFSGLYIPVYPAKHLYTLYP